MRGWSWIDNNLDTDLNAIISGGLEVLWEASFVFTFRTKLPCPDALSNVDHVPLSISPERLYYPRKIWLFLAKKRTRMTKFMLVTPILLRERSCDVWLKLKAWCLSLILEPGWLGDLVRAFHWRNIQAMSWTNSWTTCALWSCYFLWRERERVVDGRHVDGAGGRSRTSKYLGIVPSDE